MTQIHNKLLFFFTSYLIVFFLWLNLFVLHFIDLSILLLFIAFALFFLSLPARKSIFRYSKLNLSTIFKGLISSIFLYYLFYLGYIILTSLFNETIIFLEFATIIKNTFSPKWWYSIVVVCVSITEELYFRGYLQTYFMERLGTFRGLLMGATLYGVLHIPTQNPILYFAAFITSFVWGWLYIRTRNIFIPMVSHSLWTLFIFILFPFPTLTNHGFI